MATLRLAASFLFLLLSVMTASAASPGRRPRYLFGDSHISQRITTSPQTTQQQQQQQQQQQSSPENQIQFVPLISFLAEFLKFLFAKLGILGGLFGKFPMTNPTRENITQEVMVAELADEEDDDDGSEEIDEETQLLECDAAHLGLWPDRSNSQRYYKCEVDPRTPSLGNCVQDYFRERTETKANGTSQEGLLVPLVKPCFMLTVMKCANGYKYSHKTRICIPDVIFN